MSISVLKTAEGLLTDRELVVLRDYLVEKGNTTEAISTKMTMAAVAGVHVETIKHMKDAYEKVGTIGFTWWKEPKRDDRVQASILDDIDAALKEQDYREVIILASILYARELMIDLEEQTLKDEQVAQQEAWDASDEIALAEAYQDNEDGI